MVRLVWRVIVKVKGGSRGKGRGKGRGVVGIVGSG